MTIILKPFAWLLLFFYNLVGSYGFALILFALVVKVVLFPLALKGKRGMIQMNMISGKTQKLQKQYGTNKEKYNEEVQKLYAREKVNPMSGCLWSFLPLLVLLPLYAVIRQPMLYLMDLTGEQITAIANALDWSNIAVTHGWIKEATAYTTGGYNELFLASLVTPEKLEMLRGVAGGAPGLFAMNFQFFGLDLSQVPTWKVWEGGLAWQSIGLFLLPVISAVLGLMFSMISMKTNSINNASQASNPSNKMMLLMSPIMSLWIGFIMPAGLCLYWIINNLLSMGQELIASKLLKKDYAKAAANQEEQARLEKEEEKRLKLEQAEERARRLEDKKKKKPGTPEKKKAEPGVDVSASREGLRAYARGRSYDPNRFGAPTPYHDPNRPVDEAALAAARAAKEALYAEEDLLLEDQSQVALDSAAEMPAETAEVQPTQTAEDTTVEMAQEIAPTDDALTPAPQYETPDYDGNTKAKEE